MDSPTNEMGEEEGDTQECILYNFIFLTYKYRQISVWS